MLPICGSTANGSTRKRGRSVIRRSDSFVDSAACVREVSTETRYNLIEALAAAIADALLASFDVSRVRVRVRKPQVELDHPVEFTAATVERTRR